MGDKTRGAIAIVVGAFALFQSWVLYQRHWHGWRMGLEVVAGVILIALGIWRLRRRPDEV
jgi:cytochrome c biogenesis protein CcdA